jgi:hypothetical protein
MSDNSSASGNFTVAVVNNYNTAPSTGGMLDYREAHRVEISDSFIAEKGDTYQGLVITKINVRVRAPHLVDLALHVVNTENGTMITHEMLFCGEFGVEWTEWKI